MFLHRYHFEHPNTERSVTLGRWSYFWAGILGVLFVWWSGAGSLLRALAVNIAFAVIAFLMLSVTSFLPSPLPSLLMVLMVPAIVFVQGLVMVSIVRTGYRRRGWLVRTD